MSLDLSNDTHTEREQLAQKVFDFIRNPDSDKNQVKEIEFQLDELYELYPDQKPNWKKSEGVLTALICEPNAYCYRETFTEIVSVLDLSNYPQTGCLDLAKTVNSKIADPETPEEKRGTLKQMVDEMVTGGLPEYSPEIVEAFLCAPVNDVWRESFQKELRGDFDNE